LREAVACRLISDVPLGCFLSGGIDSSLVAALARRSTVGRLKTYTVGFESSATNEAAHAAKVPCYLEADHHELMMNLAAVLAEFEMILAKASEPIGDDSSVPTFLISRETRRHVTVALSRDGDDECFAGYAKYRQLQTARVLQRWLPVSRRTLAQLVGNDRVRKAAEAFAIKDPADLARWLSTLWKRRELSNLVATQCELKADRFAQQWSLRQNFAELERWTLTDMETYLEGDILVKLDRASMAVGLEARCPFLDHVFVERVLLHSCRAKETGGKSIFRQMLAKHLPKRLFDRPKRGSACRSSNGIAGR
jgi:asparagine synthase (glutamine-hydrolysing)